MASADSQNGTRRIESHRALSGLAGDRRVLRGSATDFRALDLLRLRWIPAPATAGKEIRMGALPEQHDPASRERNPEHDQLSAGVLSFIRRAYARSRATLLDTTIADERIRGSLRSAALMIVIFQTGYAAQYLHASVPRSAATLNIFLTTNTFRVRFFLSSFV